MANSDPLEGREVNKILRKNQHDLIQSTPQVVANKPTHIGVPVPALNAALNSAPIKTLSDDKNATVTATGNPQLTVNSNGVFQINMPIEITPHRLDTELLGREIDAHRFGASIPTTQGELQFSFSLNEQGVLAAPLHVVNIRLAGQQSLGVFGINVAHVSQQMHKAIQSQLPLISQQIQQGLTAATTIVSSGALFNSVADIARSHGFTLNMGGLAINRIQPSVHNNMLNLDVSLAGTIAGIYDYAECAKQLVGTTFESAILGSFEITNIENINFSDGRLFLDIAIDGSVQGACSISGVPAYDSDNNRLCLRDAKYHSGNWNSSIKNFFASMSSILLPFFADQGIDAGEIKAKFLSYLSQAANKENLQFDIDKNAVNFSSIAATAQGLAIQIAMSTTRLVTDPVATLKDLRQALFNSGSPPMTYIPVGTQLQNNKVPTNTL